jgi:hypothetical protein
MLACVTVSAASSRAAAMIGNVQTALQSGFARAHHHQPTGEKPPHREEPGHEPPGARRHLRGL